MAKQVQIIKGTTAQNEAFTGAEGALSYDSQKKNLHVHEGATEGGFEIPSSAMADYVIYWDSGDASDHSHAKPGIGRPTNARWYRYYKSGWVIQGGNEKLSNATVVTFPVRMRNTNYSLMPGGFAIANSGRLIVSKTATNFSCSIDGSAAEFTGWVIMGYAGV